jgi:transcriptional regulator with XRE-family HTH domain
VILDRELIARRRADLCLSQRMLANQLGVTSPTIASLERGDNHGDLPLRLLVRLAEALAVAVTSLFCNDRSRQADDDRDDSAAVGALLFETKVLTPIDALCDALDWPLERVRRAVEALDAELPAVGLRLQSRGGSVAIRRAVEPASAAHVQQLLRLHVLRNGVGLAEARVLYRIMKGTLPRELSNADAVALRTLANAGLIELADAQSKGSAPSWRIASHVRAALRLDQSTRA